MNNFERLIQRTLMNILFEVSTEAQGFFVREAPVQGGALSNDISIDDSNIDNLETMVGNTTAVPYALPVHTGTGLYGPKKQRIKPKNKKALKTPFGPRKSIAGQKANPYVDRGYDRLIASGEIARTIDAHMRRDLDLIVKEFLKDTPRNVPE